MKKLILGCVVCSLFVGVHAQNDPVVMTVNGNQVTKSEFEHIFKKNNKDEDITKEDLDEYLDLFINFKLKVTAAEELGMDTVKKFKDELSQYREQLAQPYLMDQSLNDQLMQEAYDHMSYEVKASHVLVKVDAGASPEDTLKAYNRILEAKNKVKDGAEFAAIAKEYSDDPSAKENGGTLGYFTAFKMVYPFEKAAYDTKPGELSEIIKTRFGYHFLRVEDKRPARGTRLAAHILIRAAQNNVQTDADASEIKAKEIYEKLKNGTSFEQMAKQFSEDRNSAGIGGKLKWFGAGDLIPAFDEALFALKNIGDISEPVKTRFGWHIIKLLDAKELGSFEDLQGEIKSKISKDGRNSKTRSSFIQKLKKEYNYELNEKVMDSFKKSLDSSVLDKDYTYQSTKLDAKELVTFANRSYTVADFGKALEKNRKRSRKKSIEQTIDSKFALWMNAEIIDYEKTQLEAKHVKYKMLMKEYRDGILLFELTDQIVWGKAVKDTSGLKSFYESRKTDFVWKKRIDADFYYCIDEKASSMAEKLIQSGIGRDSIAKLINEDSPLNVNVKSKKDEIEALEFINNEPKLGVNGPYQYNGQFVMVNVKKIIEPTNKELDEAKGIITAAYQDYLEKAWIDELREKYPVQVEKEVLYSIR
ncbi:MAG: hypothetical protein CL833_08890 [Crocinitomicaceae bacterium]|nr:hypothetical protein [Crocinitomicaceae bacterium]